MTILPLSRIQNILAHIVEKFILARQTAFDASDSNFFLKKSRKIMFQGIALLTNHDWFCFIDGPCQNSGKMLEYLPLYYSIFH
jgi:hypothetical protein